MENNILNTIKYYVELALRRPLTAILPAVAVVLVGLVVVVLFILSLLGLR